MCHAGLWFISWSVNSAFTHCTFCGQIVVFRLLLFQATMVEFLCHRMFHVLLVSENEWLLSIGNWCKLWSEKRSTSNVRVENAFTTEQTTKYLATCSWSKNGYVLPTLTVDNNWRGIRTTIDEIALGMIITLSFSPTQLSTLSCFSKPSHQTL